MLFIALEILLTDDALVANELDKAVVAKELLIANELLIALDELIANDAVPNKDPVNEVEVIEVNPASVVAVPPKLIPVLPTVTELFAKLAFVMPAVPDKFEFVNPEIDPPRVIVPVDVIVPPVKVIPDTVPAVATEVTVPVFPVSVVPLAVTEPGNIVLPDPSNNVAVLARDENTPVYCLTCIGSVPSSAVAISTKPAFVAVPPILIRN